MFQALLALGMLVQTSSINVRVTYYTLRGTMSNGEHVHLGAAACSYWIPLGTQLEFYDQWIITCKDRGDGGRYWKNWVDVWAPNNDWAQTYIVDSYGDYAWVDIVRWGWDSPNE